MKNAVERSGYTLKLEWVMEVFSCSLRKGGGLCCALSLSLLAPIPPQQGAVCCILLPSMEFLDLFAFNVFSSNVHPRQLLWPLSPSLRVDTPELSSVCGHALPHGVAFASHAWDFSASSMPNTLLVSQGCLLKLIWSNFLTLILMWPRADIIGSML